jgi:fused signal recognition particle receptor
VTLVLIIVALLVVIAVVGLYFYAGRGPTAAPPRPTTRPAPAPPTAPPKVEPRSPAADVLEPQVLEPELLEPDLLELELLEPELLEPDIAAELETLVRPSLRDRLAKARGTFAGYFGSVRSRNTITEDTWDELEEALLLADVGVEPTQELLGAMRQRVKQDGIKDPDALLDAMKAEIKGRLSGYDRTLRYADLKPSVWLFVGVNGVGKTTTIGKLARRENDTGRRVVLAAGDTFRAAAAEQLELWAERAGADIVRGQEGGDPAAIIFDAIDRAHSRGADLVLADTAGRLHTKVNLMEELRKVRRVAEKGSGTISEVLLVLDATTGQNGLTQARQFTDAVDVTGVVLTKLDGTAKGGIVLAIQQQLGIPVKLVGLGEGVGDLVEFDPDEFTDALFS